MSSSICKRAIRRDWGAQAETWHNVAPEALPERQEGRHDKKSSIDGWCWLIYKWLSLCRVCFAICFLKGDCEKDILIIVTTKKSIPTNLKFAETTPAYHAESDILEPSGDVCQRLNHLVSLKVLCCLNFAEKTKSEDNTPKCIVKKWLVPFASQDELATSASFQIL